MMSFIPIFIVFSVKNPPSCIRYSAMLCYHNTMDVVTRYLLFHFVNLKTFTDPHLSNIHTDPSTQSNFTLNLHIFSPYNLYLPTIYINLNNINSSHTSNTLTTTQIRNNKHTYTSQKTFTAHINKIVDNICNSHNSNTHTTQIITYKHIKILTFKLSLSYLRLRKIKPSRCSLTYFKLTRLCRDFYEYLAMIIILLINNSYE